MTLLRTDEMVEKYREYQRLNPNIGSCALCVKPSLQNFKYWRIMTNDFPYDLIAKDHHILIPIRHVMEKDLNKDELAELFEIKLLLEEKYDFIVEPTMKNKSIPGHDHLHLLVIKDFKVV